MYFLNFENINQEIEFYEITLFKISKDRGNIKKRNMSIQKFIICKLLDYSMSLWN